MIEGRLWWQLNSYQSRILLKMKTEETNREEIVEELPDTWWYRVYIGVVITTIVVIIALGLFSKYFSS
jgi:hypothetical protein